MPLFSIIIPVYNRADLIGQTLDSVLNQRELAVEDREIIVIDDGSTDQTMAVLKQYSDLHGIRVLQQINRGPGAARSLGLAASSGEYAAFLDSDDLWFPWTARCYRAAIEMNARPSFVTGLQREFRNISELESVLDEPVKLEVFSDYYESADLWRWFSASSFVIRRDAAIAVAGFDGGWGVSEDADIAMKLGLSPGFVHLTRPVTFGYRVHDGSVMKNHGRLFVGVSLLLDHEKSGHYPGGTARRRQRLEIISRHVRASSLTCLEGGSRTMAWDLYWRTLGWHLKLGRWKYLLGFPYRALVRRLGQRRSNLHQPGLGDGH